MQCQVICIQQTCFADEVLELGAERGASPSPARLGIHLYGSTFSFSLLQVKEAPTSTAGHKWCR